MYKKLLVLIALLAALSLLMTACGTPVAPTVPATEAPAATQAPTKEMPAATEPPTAQPPTEAPVVSDRPLIIPMGADVDTMFPDYSSTALGASLAALVYSSLTTVDLHGNVAPDLAASWEVSEDHLTWTFHLVENAVWQDGKPVTAEDVQFTYEKIADPNYNGGMYTNITSIAGVTEKQEGKATTVSGIKVVDEHTISFTTTEPDALVMDTFASPNIVVVPVHILGSIPVADLGKSDYARMPIGSGPYQLVDWKAEESMTFERNDAYYGTLPIIRQIKMPIIPEPSARVTALLNNEVDILGSVSADDYESVKSATGVTIKGFPGSEYQNFNLNLADPMFKDVRVRQAMNYAINRQSMLDGLCGGRGIVENNIFHPSLAEYNPNIASYDYNVEKAKQLLSDAGWTDKDGDGILEAQGVQGVADGTKFNTTLDTTTTPFYVQENQVIQQDLKAVGIESTINQVEFGAFFGDIWLPGPTWHASGLGWYNLIGTPQMELGWNFMCPADKNTYGYCNADLDVLINKNKTLFDKTERMNNFYAVQDIIHEAAVVTPLIRCNATVAYNQALQVSDFQTGIDLWRTIPQWSWTK